MKTRIRFQKRRGPRKKSCNKLCVDRMWRRQTLCLEVMKNVIWKRFSAIMLPKNDIVREPAVLTGIISLFKISEANISSNLLCRYKPILMFPDPQIYVALSSPENSWINLSKCTSNSILRHFGLASKITLHQGSICRNNDSAFFISMDPKFRDTSWHLHDSQGLVSCIQNKNLRSLLVWIPSQAKFARRTQ